MPTGPGYRSHDTVLPLLRQSAQEPIATVKERWQLAILRDGELPPPPLRACPAALRSTA